MNSPGNKELMQNIFIELAKGNLRHFLDAMDDDMVWTWMGSGPWAKKFTGKRAVVDELWKSVGATLVPPFKAIAENFIADGEYVVVEARGENFTLNGKKYFNNYCWVCRIAEGRIHEIREYMDTQLVTATFNG